ncbi:LPXTG cell wall anchor domain-containing protein [Streptomyces sp. NPDC005423]|uniref:LPXTG cell wall anchor domain-containing protein n=1 Tax=Streptomyces sp. NPDC005423 TaxID=3155343 RepID=UPI0033B8AD74
MRPLPRRPRSPLSACLAAAALPSAFLGALGATAPAYAVGAPGAVPACAAPADHAFPLTTRIHDGPGAYPAGGGYGTWYLDLTNTTDRRCAAVHPVVVLVDDKHALTAAQPRVAFYDGGRAHPVRFETTGRAELVGAFDDGFPGFAVDPGRTLTVKVRLAFAPDAVANGVTLKAAVVQRHADDGDWIGQSNDYRFTVDPASPAPQATPQATPRPTPQPTPGVSASAPVDSLPFADELASTGLGTRHGVLAVVSVLLVIAGALLVARRRR